MTSLALSDLLEEGTSQAAGVLIVSCLGAVRAARARDGAVMVQQRDQRLVVGDDTRKANLVHARELLNIIVPMDGDIADEPEDFRPPCPCCGGRMIIIEMFKRWRQPRGPPNTSAPNRENVP